MTSRTDQTFPASAPSTAPRARDDRRWRTVDIVVASALAVAFGVVFWAWGQLWTNTSAAFAGFPPAQGFMYGVWLLPGVLGALVIRKPGAALYTELVAAIVSALLGTAWGLSVVAYGLVEGAAPELVFAFLAYGSWRLSTSVVAGAAAGASAALLDILFYYPKWSGRWQLTYTGLLTLSSAVIAGLGAWLLVRALARTGVLAPFPSGRDQATV
ncbi:MAG: energy-coupling factor transport system permease protein [Actinomycetota bacterium]|jgi:energy-coupling factor transport system substrate-specific component|nr:energy-coupling factor transport system permease protein [Actinomycetota bacterium]